MALNDNGTKSLEEIIEVLSCPVCSCDLSIESNQLKCAGCSRLFVVSGSIPQLFCPNEWQASNKDVTSTVREFYEKTPFPNYDETDNVPALIEKARGGRFARLLDEEIPFGASVVEVGCGTGQLSNFLGVANRHVYGTDISLNSLGLAQEFKENHHLRRVHFLQMNLFKPALKPGQFDVVICNGVLHHTSNPYLGFQTIIRLLKPGGYLIIGLYHKYGRVLTNIRRAFLTTHREAFQWMDSRLRDARFGKTRRDTWFADQYLNPHESTHTIAEVLGWFRQNGIQFVGSIPGVSLWKSGSEKEKLFQREEPVGGVERFFAELLMMITNCRDAGFFIAIGKSQYGIAHDRALRDWLDSKGKAC